MRLWVQACGTALGVGLTVAAGCGGSVIVDGSGGGGDGGTGGSGGMLPGVTGVTVTATSVTTGPTSVTATSVTTGPTSVTSSVSTGPSTICDFTGDCGDGGGNGCIGCAIAPDGPCGGSYEACISDPECIDYSDCISMCDQNDQPCYQKCAESFSNGALLYNDLVVCVICDACYNDCNGQFGGCP